MKRALASIVLVGLVVALAAAGGGEGGRTFTVELDNAFGLTVGSDLKVAGVRAGTLKDIRLNPETKDALVDFEVTKTGFGDLRTDTFCESRPQSLIGEYYLDCAPGTDPKKLEPGATIPLEQTGSTIPADLVADVMRRPYRERLRIILGQLGVGLAARGDELNEAIRRASPALRETNRVLEILASQNTVLRDLVENADTVLGDLAGNRRDVGRWVREARATAADSAERRVEIAAGLNRLPGFLRELRPAMADLGRAVDAQTPALQDLDASSRRLEQLFENLGPFARSSQLNLRALGGASKIGKRAVRSAQPVVDELERFSKDTPELARNLRITLEDLDSRDRAIEENPRSPGGKGYTGLESLLQYVYDQALAINIFDSNGYILKANLFESECSEYQTAESLKEHEASNPGFTERCAAWLGPSQQGVNQPDPTLTGMTRKAKTRKTRRRARRDREDTASAAPNAPAPAPGTTTSPDSPLDVIESITDRLPALPPLENPEDLLDFLLAP